MLVYIIIDYYEPSYEYEYIESFITGHTDLKKLRTELDKHEMWEIEVHIDWEIEKLDTSKIKKYMYYYNWEQVIKICDSTFRKYYDHETNSPKDIETRSTCNTPSQLKKEAYRNRTIRRTRW